MKFKNLPTFLLNVILFVSFANCERVKNSSTDTDRQNIALAVLPQDFAGELIRQSLKPTTFHLYPDK